MASKRVTVFSVEMEIQCMCSIIGSAPSSNKNLSTLVMFRF
jgi:hypothetical protein